MDSLHIATLGTVLAVLMAVPVAFLAARNVTPYAGLNYAAKLILVAARSVNTLIWALFFVAVLGPGALAGTLAIAFHSIGFTGKLLGEALEESNRGTIEALEASGAPWLSIALKGYWPQLRPAFWATVLFRWDINVRESAVLGLVGPRGDDPGRDPCGRRSRRGGDHAAAQADYLGSSEEPVRNSSTERAHWRPSRIAQTTSDWPRRTSPAANTFGTDVT
jgi:hypothetical protein